MSQNTNASSYINQPCERCGSPKRISKTWKETIETALGKQTIEVSQVTCTNKDCQAEFDKNRTEEVARINERKVNKEEQDKVRRENIAKTVAAKKADKADKAEKATKAAAKAKN